MTRKTRTVSSVSGGQHALDRCVVPAPARPTGRAYTPILERRRDRSNPARVGVDFGLLRVRPGSAHVETTTLESVFVLLSGKVQVELAGESFRARRRSVFDEKPDTFHCGRDTALCIRSLAGAAEFAVVRTPNPRRLPARFYPNDAVTTEDRGAGLVQGACRRFVRTIFDHATRPDSHLVVGEVVNFPGRWSSYPGHHHPQPEVYHYRFLPGRGYGHAELGDSVFKVRDGDTVSIPGGLDHAQVSAPGYAMYYLWIVRHLPRRPYKGFTFAPEHRWLLDPREQGWEPGLSRK